MAKFDYKKWIVENKYGSNNPNYGSLNEQEAQTCYGCLNYSSNTNDQYNYIDMSEVVTVEWNGEYQYEWYQNANICGQNWDLVGEQPPTPNGNYGTVQYYYTSIDALEASNSCSGSVTESVFYDAGGMGGQGETGQPDPGTQLSASIAPLYSQGPVCCDPDAQNYGQNAQGNLVMMYQGGGNATDTYLMTNQGVEYQTSTGEDICNNNLCQGDVGGDSFDDTIDPNAPQGMNLAPDKIKPGTMKPKPGMKPGMNPKKQMVKRKPLKEMKYTIKKAIDKLKK